MKNVFVPENPLEYSEWKEPIDVAYLYENALIVRPH